MAESGTADSTTTTPSAGTPGGTASGLAPDLRDRMALALDVDDLVEANRLARQLRPWFGVAKIGLELFTAAGPDAINAMLDLGYDVFLDLKLHDIPTTVRKSAGVAGALGVTYLTMHASGGPAMLRAGVEGFLESAHRAGMPTPTALGITVLDERRRRAGPHCPQPAEGGRRGGLRGSGLRRLRPGRRSSDGTANDAGRAGHPGCRRGTPRPTEGGDAGDCPGRGR